MLLPSAIFLILIVCAYGEKVEYQMTEAECREAGLNQATLQCSSCEKLAQFNLETLMSDCLACCTKEKELQHEKYPLAHVEVCECNLARFPQVQAFVRNDMASQWTGVKVKHVRGVRPQIVLKDHNGVTRETLNIEKWDTDTIVDFLNQWIESCADESDNNEYDQKTQLPWQVNPGLLPRGMLPPRDSRNELQTSNNREQNASYDWLSQLGGFGIPQQIRDISEEYDSSLGSEGDGRLSDASESCSSSSRHAAMRRTRRSNETDEEYYRRMEAAEAAIIRKMNETEEEKAIRKAKNAEIRRMQRMIEPEDKRQLRLAKLAEKQRRIRMEESEEEKLRRRSEVAQASRIRRSMEPEERKAIRREKNAARARQKRAEETEEEKAVRLSKAAIRARMRRANEDEEVKQQRRERSAARERKRRQEESEEQRMRRRALSAERARLSRAPPEVQEEIKQRLEALKKRRFLEGTETLEEQSDLPEDLRSVLAMIGDTSMKTLENAENETRISSGTAIIREKKDEQLENINRLLLTPSVKEEAIEDDYYGEVPLFQNSMNDQQPSTSSHSEDRYYAYIGPPRYVELRPHAEYNEMPSSSLINGKTPVFMPAELKQLRSQLEQHVQLLTQQAVMSFHDPILNDIYKRSTSMLRSIKNISDSRKLLPSVFAVSNLSAALRSISEISRCATVEPTLIYWARKKGSDFFPRPEVCIILSQSSALLYPDLIPETRQCRWPTPLDYLLEEEKVLLVQGLMQFSGNLLNEIERFNLISLHYLPNHTAKQLKMFFDELVASKTNKPSNELDILLSRAYRSEELILHYPTEISSDARMSEGVSICRWTSQPSWYKEFSAYFDFECRIENITRKTASLEPTNNVEYAPFMSLNSSN